MLKSLDLFTANRGTQHNMSVELFHGIALGE